MEHSASSKGNIGNKFIFGEGGTEKIERVGYTP